jgi:serine/threonine protein phosphatase 1
MGDIHGAHKALIQCLERSGFDNEKDTLIQLGDVADGWPEVPECVETLLGIKNLIAIRGNYDMWTRQWLEYGERHRVWVQQGGQATLDAYVRTGKVADERHRQFFINQCTYFYDEAANRVFVHGGFTSHRGIGHEPYQSNYLWGS